LLLLSVALLGAGCRSAGVSTTKEITPPEGVKGINGAQLYYKAIGKGQPLVFLHGSGGSHRYFLPHLQPLAGEYQLLFYDQRGTGFSDGRPDLADTIDQFVEDLESLRVTFGFEKISLIGHSWGAIIALFYALKHQDHLDKLILVDPVPIAPMFLIEQYQTIRQRVARLSPEMQQMLITCQGSSSELRSEVRTECLKIDAALRFYDPAGALTMDTTIDKNTTRNAATINSLKATSFTRKQRDLDANLKTIRVPTLLIHGDFDPIPIGSSKYIQQRIPKSQLIIMKQSGHFPFVEQPEQFLAAIRAFMRA
jgi:proline iminopeptidase